MSSPRDRDGDGFDDRPGEGSGWQEPAHLGKDSPGGGDRPADPGRSGDGAGWQPPGWDLPSATPGSPSERESSTSPDYQAGPDPSAGPDPRRVQGPPVWGGLLGGRRPRTPGEVQRIFAYQGDAVGAQGWAVQHGWTVSDGTAPEDAVLAELVASAPVRATKDHRPAGVMRGRYGRLELVAFDVLYASGRYAVPEYAITAAPVLGTVPGFRLSPARFWKHRTGGLVRIPSGDDEFDGRWVLLAAEDGPAVRRLAADRTVHGLLLGSDDGDEFWSAAGHVAAIRPDGQRPELIEHHARLLAAVVAALADVS